MDPTFEIDYLASNIGVCYYDPDSNMLRELDEQIMLKTLPYETSIRRFYLAHMNSLGNNRITTIVNASGCNKEAYTIKVLVGEINTVESYFDRAFNSSTVLYDSLPIQYSNAVPIDILIQSHNKSEMSTVIDISVQIEEKVFE